MRKLISTLSLMAACLGAGGWAIAAEETAGGTQAAGTITPAPDAAAAAEEPKAEESTSDETKADETKAGQTAESTPPADYRWSAGPQTIKLLDQASLKLPAGYTYLEGAQAQQLLRQFGNPNVADVVGVVSGPGKDWLVVVRFGKVGFVQDGQTEGWDVDGLLETIKKGVGQTNAARSEAGAQEIEVLGWIQPPSYDAATRRLSWGIATRDLDDAEEEAQAINYTVFALGRDGYVSLNLVSSLVDLERNRAHADAIAAAFDFNEGKRYTDFDQEKDELAKFDLFGLVSNAATAANPDAGPPAEKAGGKTMWIVLIIALAALILLAAAWFLLMNDGKDASGPAEANAGSA